MSGRPRIRPPFADIDALALLYAGQRVTGNTIRAQQNSPAYVEVFAGNAHMARSATSAGFDPVHTIDCDASHAPSMCVDVTVADNQVRVRSEMLDIIRQGRVIAGHWSPDCSQFSVLRTCGDEERDVAAGLHLLKCGIECFLMRDTCCLAAWTLENPYHTREYSLWSHLDCRVAVIDYCAYAWEARKPTGFAASDEQLQDALDNAVAARCPGAQDCPQCWREGNKHATDVQSMPPKRRKCIPPMLAHCLVMHVRRRVHQLALELATAVDKLLTGNAQARIARLRAGARVAPRLRICAACRRR